VYLFAGVNKWSMGSSSSVDGVLKQLQPQVIDDDDELNKDEDEEDEFSVMEKESFMVRCLCILSKVIILFFRCQRKTNFLCCLRRMEIACPFRTANPWIAWKRVKMSSSMLMKKTSWITPPGGYCSFHSFDFVEWQIFTYCFSFQQLPCF
jgi:hypothetical protein